MAHRYADIRPGDHIDGDPNARVKLLEYGDYECPFCGAAHPVVKSIKQALGDNLCFVFRNFPLRTAHPHSENAAETAEAGADAGRFWPLHDMLFENQDALEDEDLLNYGAHVGLDPAKLAQDLASHRYFPRVQADLISGMRAGVNGTPTFFINGVRHDGTFEYESLMSAILANAP